MAVLIVMALVLSLISLNWPMVNDLPIMLYGGFLTFDLGLAPYQDFWELNAPGSILLYGGLHLLTDGSILACRWLDLLLLAGICALTCRTLRDHGYQSGILASTCFVVGYLSSGPKFSLQREFFCVFLVAASMAVLWGSKDRDLTSGRFLVVGLLAGFAGSIKPPALMLWGPLVLSAVTDNGRVVFESDALVKLKDRIRFGLAFLVGAGGWFLLVAAWLFSIGSLGAFIHTVTEYYPLYSQISGSGEVYQGLSGLFTRYVLNPGTLISKSPFILLVFIGVVSTSGSKDKLLNGQVLTLVLYLAFAILYVSLSGKFWYYHKLPVIYGFGLLAGLALSHRLPFKGRLGWGHAIPLLVAIGVAVPGHALMREVSFFYGGGRHPTDDGVVDTVTRYLWRSTSPSDRIMPLDTVGGAIHSLYVTRRPLYGYCLYDFPFYHHVGTSYTQEIRGRQMRAFDDGGPEVVLDFESWRPTGVGTSEGFPALDAVLDQNYVVDLDLGHAKIRRLTEEQPAILDDSER